MKKITAEKLIEEVKNELENPSFKKQKLYLSVSKKDFENLKKEEQREEKKEIQPEKPKQKPKKRKKNLKLNVIKRFLQRLPRLLDENDKAKLKDLFVYAAVFGLILNYSVFVIFGLKFTWYSWLGWGLGLWFLENKFVNIIRRIIRK